MQHIIIKIIDVQCTFKIAFWYRRGRMTEYRCSAECSFIALRITILTFHIINIVIVTRARFCIDRGIHRCL